MAKDYCEDLSRITIAYLYPLFVIWFVGRRMHHDTLLQTVISSLTLLNRIYFFSVILIYTRRAAQVVKALTSFPQVAITSRMPDAFPSLVPDLLTICICYYVVNKLFNSATLLQVVLIA